MDYSKGRVVGLVKDKLESKQYQWLLNNMQGWFHTVPHTAVTKEMLKIMVDQQKQLESLSESYMDLTNSLDTKANGNVAIGGIQELVKIMNKPVGNNFKLRLLNEKIKLTFKNMRK